MAEPQKSLHLTCLPNTACTRLVGVTAFLGFLRGLELVPTKWRYLVLPTRK